MIERKVIQSLTLDVSAFKQRFKTAASLSAYERINKKALEIKQAKWAAHEPLARQQLFDSLIDEPPHVLLGGQSTNAPARSTINGVMYAQALADLRPTEILMVLHALGLFKFEEEDPVIRLEPVRKVRWCIGCKTFKATGMFATDMRNPSGLAFCCVRCRIDNERSIFRRSSDSGKPVLSKRLAQRKQPVFHSIASL